MKPEATLTSRGRLALLQPFMKKTEVHLIHSCICLILAIKVRGRPFSRADVNKSLWFMLRALPQYQASTILEQKCIKLKHVVARIARLDSCRAFSQKGQEFTQPHSNTADVLRVCALVYKCSTNAGMRGIHARKVLCS